MSVDQLYMRSITTYFCAVTSLSSQSHAECICNKRSTTLSNDDLCVYLHPAADLRVGLYLGNQ